MEENLNAWITFEEEYDNKYYRFLKCPFCNPKILIRPGSGIPKYCPYCGIRLKFVKLKWDDEIVYNAIN